MTKTKLIRRVRRVAVGGSKRCEATLSTGVRCEALAVHGTLYCVAHRSKNTSAKPMPFNLLEWLNDNKIIYFSQNFSLEEYPYMHEIYASRHPNRVIMKPSQVGVTTFLEICGIAFLKEVSGSSVIHTFPSKGEASLFSKQKLNLILKENHKTFTGLDPTITFEYSNVYEKQIGKSFYFIRGAWEERQAITIPADILINDELDSSKADIIALFQSRLGNSDYKIHFKAGVPTYPEVGIHKAFLDSDQRHWWYKCEHCGYKFKLCCSYPEVLQEENETPYYGCPVCHMEINRKGGVWIPENPKSNIVGWHISKLICPRVSARDLISDLDAYDADSSFFNHSLGLPYTGADSQLTETDIEACEDGRVSLMVRDKNTVMGVDQGGDDLYTIVLRPKGDSTWDIVYIDYLKGINAWRELETIITQLGVIRAVFDGLPNTQKAREVQDRFKRKIFLHYYESSIKGDTRIVWDAKKGIVLSNRSMSLELMFQRIRNQKIRIPPSEKFGLFKKHLTALKRQKVVDKHGDERYEFVKIRNDHYAHTLNYALIAADGIEVDTFKMFKPDFNPRRMEEGKWRDDVLNYLARYILRKSLTINNLVDYRCAKRNGKFVEEMNLDEKVKRPLRLTENKFGVKDFLANLEDLNFLRDRVKTIIESNEEWELKEEEYV